MTAGRAVAACVGLGLLSGCSPAPNAQDGGALLASQSIGPAGGSVSAPGGPSLQIPPGALATTISVSVAAAAIPAPAGASWVGGTFLFGPEGTQFTSPVTVTLLFAPSQLPAGATADEVAVYTAPAGTNAFAALPTTLADATHVQAQVTHFSVFGPAVGCSPACGPGEVCCGSACTSVTQDPDNCGKCGNACAGVAAVCCGGACTDPLSDPGNCGACGNACGAGMSCADGGCVAGPAGCAPSCGTGEVCCGSTCANVASDSGNCGMCGNVCGPAATCCDGGCVDTLVNAGDCGACGNVCAAGQSCLDGVCQAGSSSSGGPGSSSSSGAGAGGTTGTTSGTSSSSGSFSSSTHPDAGA